MFISKVRDIVIPQSEHQRLAGILAQHWGNSNFSLPSISRTSFQLGVATHDRAFGALDTAAIGAISDQEREVQVDQWLSTTYRDPEAELVVLLHVRRLINDPSLQVLYQKVDNRVQSLVSTHNLDLSLYEQADTITNFCDMVAFDFSFETPIKQTATVYQNKTTVTNITYALNNGTITVDKWPFSVPNITGYILGYQQKGYPDNLEPILLDFQVIQK